MLASKPASSFANYCALLLSVGLSNKAQGLETQKRGGKIKREEGGWYEGGKKELTRSATKVNRDPMRIKDVTEQIASPYRPLEGESNKKNNIC